MEITGGADEVRELRKESVERIAAAFGALQRQLHAARRFADDSDSDVFVRRLGVDADFHGRANPCGDRESEPRDSAHRAAATRFEKPDRAGSKNSADQPRIGAKRSTSCKFG